MPTTEKRTSIIASISDWLKLLALVILIAEAVILLAMWQTPSEKPIFIIYPIVMILLLVVVIAAVLYDRKSERESKELTLHVNDKKLSVNTSEQFELSQNEDKANFRDSLLGYSFYLPKKDGWSKPQEITYFDYLKKIMLGNEIDEEKVKANYCLNNPFGTLQYNSKIVEIQYGKDLQIELDDQTTTDSVESYIKKFVNAKLAEGQMIPEDQIIELRQQLNQTDKISKLGFAVKMDVMVMQKSDYQEPQDKLNLSNLFTFLASNSREPLDSLRANEDSILWTASTKLNNVLIDGKRYSSMHIYRMYQLLENQKYIFLCIAQWSPQSDSALTTWDMLKKMFESLKIQK